MKWNIKKIILALCVVGGLFSLILIGILGFEIYTIGVVKRIEVDKSFMVKVETQNLIKDIVEIQQWLTDISATRAQDGLDDGYAEAGNSYKSAIKRIDWLSQNSDAEIANAVQKLPENLTAFYETGKVMADIYINQGVTAGNKFMESFDKDSAALQVEVKSLVELVDKSLMVDRKEIGDSVRYAMYASIILVFFAVLAFGLLGRYFYKLLSSSLGDSVGEIGVCYSKLNKAANSLKGNGSSLLETVQKQASSLQQSASAMDQINAMVQRTSEKSEEASTLSEKSLAASVEGIEKVKNMIDSISEIEKSNNQIEIAMANSNKEMAGLVEIIASINEKTQVINDIVFQTKLLSFNASVEAARAGEHGKGFAVVAEEIGGLAAMSGKASDEIKDLLENSMSHVSDSSTKTKTKIDSLLKSSKDKLDRGIDFANDCNQTFDLILGNVKESDRAVGEIFLASKEQASGIHEVNAALSTLNSGSEHGADVSGVILELGNDLVGQVDQLHHAVVIIDELVDKSA